MVNSLYVYIILCCSRKSPYCSPPPSHPPQNELEIPGGMRRAQTSKNAKVYLQFSREVGRGLRKNPFHRRGFPLIHSYATKMFFHFALRERIHLDWILAGSHGLSFKPSPLLLIILH